LAELMPSLVLGHHFGMFCNTPQQTPLYLRSFADAAYQVAQSSHLNGLS